jgi:hypothetical protein
MTSSYVKCDGCEAVVDRYPADHPKGMSGDGTFGRFNGHAAREHAQSIGWTYVNERDFCPACSKEKLNGR